MAIQVIVYIRYRYKSDQCAEKMKERVYGRELKLELKLMLIASGARRSCEEGAPLSTSFLLPSFFNLPCIAAIKTAPSGDSVRHKMPGRHVTARAVSYVG